MENTSQELQTLQAFFAEDNTENSPTAGLQLLSIFYRNRAHLARLAFKPDNPANAEKIFYLLNQRIEELQTLQGIPSPNPSPEPIPNLPALPILNPDPDLAKLDAEIAATKLDKQNDFDQKLILWRKKRAQLSNSLADVPLGNEHNPARKAIVDEIYNCNYQTRLIWQAKSNASKAPASPLLTIEQKPVASTREALVIIRNTLEPKVSKLKAALTKLKPQSHRPEKLAEAQQKEAHLAMLAAELKAVREQIATIDLAALAAKEPKTPKPAKATKAPKPTQP